MTRYILLLLFVATMGSRALGLEFGLGPGISIKNALVYAAASFIAIESAITRGRTFELLSVIVPFGLLIVYAMLTWAVIVMFLDNPLYGPMDTLVRLKVKLVDQFIVLLVFFYGVTNWKDALWLLKALTWVVILGCFITVVDTFDIPDLGIVTAREDDGRIEGIVGSAGEFGGLLAFFIPATVALWWTEAGSKKLFALAGVALALVSLMLSTSRGSMVGLAAGGVAAAIILRQYVSIQILVRTTMAVMAFVAVAAVIVMSTDFGYLLQERLSTGFETGSAETISSGRTAIWSAAFREMTEYPLSFLTGLGWETYYQTIGRRLATHSVYLDRLYNLGVLGLTLFVLPYVAAIVIARRGLAKVSQEAFPYLMATVIGMISFMIAMAFTDLQGAATYMWAYAGLALRVALSDSDSASVSGTLQPFDATPLSRDQTNPATRPMSVTPRR